MSYSMAAARKRFEKATKLTEIVNCAIDDFDKIIVTPGYKINMDFSWHHKENAKCEVCFAGAVMARRYIKDTNKEVRPSDFKRSVEAKFEAINEFREGKINSALELLYKGMRVTDEIQEEFLQEVDDCDFESQMDRRSARRFIKLMRKWMRRFAEMGL